VLLRVAGVALPFNFSLIGWIPFITGSALSCIFKSFPFGSTGWNRNRLHHRGLYPVNHFSSLNLHIFMCMLSSFASQPGDLQLSCCNQRGLLSDLAQCSSQAISWCPCLPYGLLAEGISVVHRQLLSRQRISFRDLFPLSLPVGVIQFLR
jgi:hypothetical protein